MKCPYCDTEFDVEALIGYTESQARSQNDKMTWDTSAGGEWVSEEREGLRAYICHSCGGEIIGNADTAATACPFCGNPVVLTQQLTGTLRPDYVIPFRLDKKAAKQKLAAYLKGKYLLPKAFKDENHIDEVKGIYVPFWLFDTDAQADVRYRATRLRSWSDSRYRYSETSVYLVDRSGTIRFEHIPVDGSSNMDDTLMESIEPFDFGEMKPFQMPYLSGYMADKYNVTAEEVQPRANERVKRSVQDAFASTVKGYSTVTAESSYVSLSDGHVKYALLPVWILNTKWKGQLFTFAMNGQTGKFVGDLPVDAAAARRLFAGLSVVFGAAACGLTWLLWMLRIL